VAGSTSPRCDAAGGLAITGADVLVVLPSLMQSLLAGLADDHAMYGGLHAFDRAAHPGHPGLPLHPGPAARVRGTMP
jgi:hypothetical protein